MTIKGTSWALMRVGDPVGVQNYGHVTRALAVHKAGLYAQATPGDYELVRIEHIEREAERFPIRPLTAGDFKAHKIDPRDLLFLRGSEDPKP